MKRAFLCAAGLSLVFSTCSYAVEIENFRAGLVCEEKFETDEAEAIIRWICFETETIYITGQGDCVYDGRDEKCTWYGIEFDYKNMSEDEKIWCVSNSTSPVNLGNPRGVTDENVMSSEYEMKVEPGDGREFIAGYVVSSSRENYEGTNTELTVCSVDGHEVFRFRFTTISPSISKDTFRHAVYRARIVEKTGSE